MHVSHCRSCGCELHDVMVDLGAQPRAVAPLTRAELGTPEPRFPLRVMVCRGCLLAQLDETEGAVLPPASVTEYADHTDSGRQREHDRAYAGHLVDRFQLGGSSLVVQIASQDGCLLDHFISRRIPALGIEPVPAAARAARRSGVPTRVGLFSASAAKHLLADGYAADVVIATHVLPRVAELNDFVRGIARLLKPEGVAALECPHLMRLIESCGFDTIDHEHRSYFSLIALERVCARHGLRVFDVEERPERGGSLRVFLQHVTGTQRLAAAVTAMRTREHEAGLEEPGTYVAFGGRVEAARDRLRRFLIEAKQSGAAVAGYGALAGGATLLNTCAITPDLLPVIVDPVPERQNRFLPGSRIPVQDPAVLRETKPQYLLVLPWPLREELAAQLSWIGEWGGRFVTPLPTLREWPADGAAAA